MEAEREGFRAAFQGKRKPEAKGQWGKRAQGWWCNNLRSAKGRAPEWWCPIIQRWCTMADIDERIKELQTKAEKHDDALAQHKDDNKDGSTL